MELRVDLSDLVDIEAAYALLAVIKQGAPALKLYAGFPAQPSQIDEFAEKLRTFPTNHTAAAAPAAGTEEPDTRSAAEVFPPLGSGAPSTAGVGALPNVPGALLDGVATSAPVSAPLAPSAPTSAGAPVASAASTSVDIDKDGLPWDNRIHSTPATKTAKGVWRAKRGLNDPAMVSRVQAELRATMAIPVGGAPVATAAAPLAPPAPPVQSAAVPPAPAATAPSAPVAPPAPAATPTAAASTDPTTGAELLPRVTAAQAAGIMPQAALLEACAAYQLPSIPALFQRPDMVPSVWALLKQQYPTI